MAYNKLFRAVGISEAGSDDLWRVDFREVMEPVAPGATTSRQNNFSLTMPLADAKAMLGTEQELTLAPPTT